MRLTIYLQERRKGCIRIAELYFINETVSDIWTRSDYQSTDQSFILFFRFFFRYLARKLTRAEIQKYLALVETREVNLKSSAVNYNFLQFFKCKINR